MGAYSFYPTKNLGTFGDGGNLVTNSEEIKNNAQILRNYGQTERYNHSRLGLNSRLDELHAAILLTRSNWLEQFIEKHKQIAETCCDEIKNPKIKLLKRPQHRSNHVYHLFVILSEEREKLSSFLKSHGIQSNIPYPVPAHQQKQCKKYKGSHDGLKMSECHAPHYLSIPCHPHK